MTINFRVKKKQNKMKKKIKQKTKWMEIIFYDNAYKYTAQVFYM